MEVHRLLNKRAVAHTQRLLPSMPCQKMSRSLMETLEVVEDLEEEALELLNWVQKDLASEEVVEEARPALTCLEVEVKGRVVLTYWAVEEEEEEERVEGQSYPSMVVVEEAAEVVQLEQCCLMEAAEAEELGEQDL